MVFFSGRKERKHEREEESVFVLSGNESYFMMVQVESNSSSKRNQRTISTTFLRIMLLRKGLPMYLSLAAVLLFGLMVVVATTMKITFSSTNNPDKMELAANTRYTNTNTNTDLNATTTIKPYHPLRGRLQQQQQQQIKLQQNPLPSPDDVQRNQILQSLQSMSQTNGGREMGDQQDAAIKEHLANMVRAKSKQKFVSNIQSLSQEAVLEKYGSGPYYVQVTLLQQQKQQLQQQPSLPPSSSSPSSFFVLELANLQNMPHTVHHFLEMVEYGLWNGMTLVHGLGVPTIHAIPQTTSGINLSEKMERIQLGHLPFQEQGGFPHTKYTVSFSKKGGPDFYINMNDESESHEDSTSMEGNKEKEEEEENTPSSSSYASCFAKVVQGMDVLDRMVQGGDPMENMRFIGIESMTVWRPPSQRREEAAPVPTMGFANPLMP